MTMILRKKYRVRLSFSMIIATGFVGCVLVCSIPQAAKGLNVQDGAEAKTAAQPTSDDAGTLSPIDELIKWYERAQEQIQSLRAEAAQLRMELKQVSRERDELKQFIEDHDEYGSDFAKYTVFKTQQAQADLAKKAAAAKAKREAKKRRLQELRKKRMAAHTNTSKTGNPLSDRVQLLQQAGYTPIGDSVLVGQMGYVYKTETQKEYRYSPYFENWYLDENETVDYRHLTLSGSIIHAAESTQDISFVIAFYDEHGGQIGQTTVRVDGARPGVPYPFTAEVVMAADEAFDNYTAWVLYAEPSNSGGDVIDPVDGNGTGGNGAAGGNSGGDPSGGQAGPGDNGAGGDEKTKPADGASGKDG